MTATIDAVRAHLQKHNPNEYCTGRKIIYVIEDKVWQGMLALVKGSIFWRGKKRGQDMTNYEVGEIDVVIIDASDIAA